MARGCEVREMRIAEAALTIVRARLETRSLESGLRSKDSRAVRRGAVGKVPDMGNSLAAYPTARPVLNGGCEETCRKVTRLAPTQLECGMCGNDTGRCLVSSRRVI
jgi:hypothetical protein